MLDRFIIYLFIYFVNLTQTRVTWEKVTSIGEFSSSDCPVEMSVGAFILANNWYEMTQSIVGGAIVERLGCL